MLIFAYPIVLVSAFRETPCSPVKELSKTSGIMGIFVRSKKCVIEYMTQTDYKKVHDINTV